PAAAVAGPVLVTARSAEVVTVVVAVAVLLVASGALVALVTVTELVMVEPFNALELTWATMVKVAEAPAARDVVVKVVVPAPANAGAEVWVEDTRVALAGRVSVTVTFWASEGPALVTVMV